MISEKQWIESFKEELKYYMKEKNISQRELADRSRLDESTISRCLRENKIPNARTINNIAHALGVDVGQLMDFGHLIE